MDWADAFAVPETEQQRIGSWTQESLSRKRHVKSNLCIVAYRAEKHGGVHSGTMWAYVQWVSFPCLFGRSATIISCLSLSSRGHCGAPHKVQHKYNTEGQPGGQPLAVRGIRVGRGHGLQIQPRDSFRAVHAQDALLPHGVGGRCGVLVVVVYIVPVLLVQPQIVSGQAVQMARFVVA